MAKSREEQLLLFIKNFKPTLGSVRTGMRFVYQEQKFIVHAAADDSVSYSAFEGGEVYSITAKEFRAHVRDKRVKPVSHTLD